MHLPETDVLTVFPSRLGWMAMIGSGSLLKHLTFGHTSAKRAVAGLIPEMAQRAEQSRWNEPLIERVQAYASGAHEEFLDVEVDLGSMTGFRRRVLECARRVPFGTTVTYGQLAAQAGFPGAARAVGRCMASNPIPLVIPCHRVVAADGSLCGFSAFGGVRTKQLLLRMESPRCAVELA